MTEFEVPKKVDPKLIEVANLYAEIAISKWLWNDLVGIWTRQHIESKGVIDYWFKGLGDKLDQIWAIHSSLPEPNQEIRELIQEYGIAIITERNFRRVEYISRATKSEVLDRTREVKAKIESNPEWNVRFRNSKTLPKTTADWQEKFAVSPYKAGPRTNINSWAGGLVSRYKYSRHLGDQERNEIAIEMAKGLSDFIVFKFSATFVDASVPPFDACLGIPANNTARKALPADVAKLLAQKHPWLIDIGHCVQRKRDIDSIKGLPEDEKRKELLGLYGVDPTRGDKPRWGILVFDDVYTSGATSDEIFTSLNDAYPNVPKYFISLTYTGPKGAMR